MATGMWVWVGDVVAAVTGGLLGGRLQQRRGHDGGATAPPRGSLLAGLLKAKLGDAEHAEALAWVKQLELRNPLAKMRFERAFNNDEIADILKRPSAQWNDFVPASVRTRVETILPEIDARTASQIHQTFGGSVRRQGKRAQRRTFHWVLLKFFLMLVVLLALVILFPDASPFGWPVRNWLKTL